MATEGTPRPPVDDIDQMLDARWDLENPGTTRYRYLILSQQRTGSTYLARRLCNVPGRWGLPSEYMNPQAISELPRRLLPGHEDGQVLELVGFLSAVERVRTTADGWFGMKLQPQHLRQMLPGQKPAWVALLSRFDRIITIVRRDKIGQAVSGAIAAHTRHWINHGDEPPVPPADDPVLYPLVATHLSRYIREDGDMHSVVGKLAKLGKPALALTYEEIEHDPDGVFASVVDFLGRAEAGAAAGTSGHHGPGTEAAAGVPAVPLTRKPPGEVAARVRAGFLRWIQGQEDQHG